MAASIKMDELLVLWLGSDTVYENVEKIIEGYQTAATRKDDEESTSQTSPRGVIPPFYPKGQTTRRRHRWNPSLPMDTWLTPPTTVPTAATSAKQGDNDEDTDAPAPPKGVKDQVQKIMRELEIKSSFKVDQFQRFTKEICGLPSFCNGPLFNRITSLWGARHGKKKHPPKTISMECLKWFWTTEMEPFDAQERFFRLLKQPNEQHIARDDFLPYIQELLAEHPGLEFLSDHAEFQEKYAVTVITRIFYTVNKCHSGRITLRQIRRSDLLDAFLQVDQEEDINRVTRYFSYEHFYVLYCRFWELDRDRDYRITREDLLRYSDRSLSHMIVDRIFDAAPRPFGRDAAAAVENEDANNNDYLSYEDFIFFMLSEEDKANEVSVQYWFTCVDVDGDGRLNNMEMRSFYAVQLHRMQSMGHEIVPFEDMLCQMMDMIKPKNSDYLVEEDFLQSECKQVSGALFDALFNLNKYLMFEQRDPFVERQKREDEFESDWDRFACTDYNRLAMEEEAIEEEAIEIDWVTVDEEEEEEDGGGGGGAANSNEAPF